MMPPTANIQSREQEDNRRKHNPAPFHPGAESGPRASRIGECGKGMPSTSLLHDVSASLSCRGTPSSVVPGACSGHRLATASRACCFPLPRARSFFDVVVERVSTQVCSSLSAFSAQVRLTCEHLTSEKKYVNSRDPYHDLCSNLASQQLPRRLRDTQRSCPPV